MGILNAKGFADAIGPALMMIGAMGKPQMQANILANLQAQAERRRQQNQYQGLLSSFAQPQGGSFPEFSARTNPPIVSRGILSGPESGMGLSEPEPRVKPPVKSINGPPLHRAHASGTEGGGDATYLPPGQSAVTGRGILNAPEATPQPGMSGGSVGILANPQLGMLTPQQIHVLRALPPDVGMKIMAGQVFQDGQEPTALMRHLEAAGYTPGTPEYQEAMRKLVLKEDGGGLNIGTYNPRDYTPESWAKFIDTQDPRVLRRYERDKTYRIDTGTEELIVDEGSGSVIARYPRHGRVPEGFITQPDPQQPGGVRMEPAPGSPTEREERARLEQSGIAAQTVVRDIDRAITDLENPYAAGYPGVGLLSNVVGSPSQVLEDSLNSVRSNIGIDSLLRIKQSGAGLGHIPQSQLETLQGLLGRMNVRTRPDRLKKNLEDAKRIYADIVRKAAEKGEVIKPGGEVSRTGRTGKGLRLRDGRTITEEQVIEGMRRMGMTRTEFLRELRRREAAQGAR